MYVNYEWYKVFCMVVKCKSITAAAKEMNLTQPTVSHYIQKLEESLQCSLFIRGKKGIILTPEGEIIFRYIDIACENIKKAEKELESYKNNESGELIIGANETTLHHFLLPYISKFRKLYSGIKLKIYNNVAPLIMEQIEKGNIDCGIIFNYTGYQKGEFLTKELLNVPSIIIAGQELVELKNCQVTLNELRRYPLIGLDSNTISGQSHRKFFIDNNMQYNPDIVLATADLVTPVVAENLGIGFVPKPFALDALKQGKVFEVQIKETMPSLSICFICQKNRINKPSVKALLDCINKIDN